MDEEPYGDVPLEALSRSLDLRRRAGGELPEASSSNYRGATAYAPYPMLYMADGDGAILTDVDGNEYVDFHCGVSAIITGHSPAAQVEAVREQVGHGSYFATGSESEYEAARRLNDLLPHADRTKFVSTGTEAVTSAVRLARAYTGKDTVLKFEGMYHGHTDYALVNVHPPTAALGSRRNPTAIPDATGIPASTLESVTAVPWNDAELVREAFERAGDDVAAVITEAVMSNSGLLWPRPGYLDELRRLTREHDALLILDEVVTGFRMGLTGAQGYFDLEPDLAVYGKALANGYPCAAVTGREEIMRFVKAEPDKATWMGTFSGNPLVTAATAANLELLADVGEAGYAELYEKGERLAAGIREIAADAGHDVFVPDFAGFFCMHFTDGETDPTGWTEWRDIAPHVNEAAYEQFAAAMVGEGIFLPPKPGRINLMHAHTDEHIDRALAAAKVAIDRVPA